MSHNYDLHDKILEVERLKKQNKILVEALKYYADRNNWACRIYGPDDFNNLIDRDEDGYFQRADEMEVVKDAGEKAREVLKEIENENSSI